MGMGRRGWTDDERRGAKVAPVARANARTDHVDRKELAYLRYATALFRQVSCYLDAIKVLSTLKRKEEKRREEEPLSRLWAGGASVIRAAVHDEQFGRNADF